MFCKRKVYGLCGLRLKMLPNATVEVCSGCMTDKSMWSNMYKVLPYIYILHFFRLPVALVTPKTSDNLLLVSFGGLDLHKSPSNVFSFDFLVLSKNTPPFYRTFPTWRDRLDLRSTTGSRSKSCTKILRACRTRPQSRIPVCPRVAASLMGAFLKALRCLPVQPEVFSSLSSLAPPPVEFSVCVESQ